MDLHTYKVHSLIFITSCPGSQRKLEPSDSLRNSNNKKILINLKKQQTQQESFPRYDPPPLTGGNGCTWILKTNLLSELPMIEEIA